MSTKFVPLSVTLTFAGITRTTQSKISRLHFLTPFSWRKSNSSWVSRLYFWVRVIELRELSAVFTDSQKFSHWHAFRFLWSSLVQTCFYDRYYRTFYFGSSACYPDHDSNSQGCQKVKTSAPIISQSLQWVLSWILSAAETCWSDYPHIHTILSDQYAREWTQLLWFHFGKKIILACIQAFTDWFLSKVGMMIDTTKLCFLIPDWMTLFSFWTLWVTDGSM